MQYVPAAFRQNALGSIRQEYEKNLARLRAAKSEAEKAAVNVTGATSARAAAGSDGGAADHSDAESSAASGSQPQTTPASAEIDGSTGGADAAKSADGQVSASAESAGSANDADASKAPVAQADDATGSATPAADASSAGEASTSALASLDSAQDNDFLSRAPRLLLAVCVGLALPATMAFASRAFRSRAHAEEDLENPNTPYLSLDSAA